MLVSTKFKDIKVLVAGGTGFVGINLVNRLLSLGANVRATIHRKDPVILDKRIEYIGKRCFQIKTYQDTFSKNLI